MVDTDAPVLLGPQTGVCVTFVTKPEAGSCMRLTYVGPRRRMLCGEKRRPSAEVVLLFRGSSGRVPLYRGSRQTYRAPSKRMCMYSR